MTTAARSPRNQPAWPGPAATATATDDEPTPGRGWVWLLRVACLAAVAGAVLMQLAGRFVGPSLVVYIVLVAGAALALPRFPRSAAWVLLVVSALDLVMHAFMLSVLVEGLEVGILYALTVLGIVCTVLMTVSAVNVVRRREGRTRTPVRLLAIGAAVLTVAVATTSSFYLTRDSDEAAQAEPVLATDGMRVSDDSLVLQAEGGSASLVLRNDDWFYPRSFDIDALDLHVVVPPRTGRRIELPTGRYEFYDYVTMTDATSGVVTVQPE